MLQTQYIERATESEDGIEQLSGVSTGDIALVA
jgi:hypothetical protein